MPSELDGKLVWGDTQIITTAYAEKQIFISPPNISADLETHHRTDACVEEFSFPLLDTRGFNHEANYISDGF